MKKDSVHVSAEQCTQPGLCIIMQPVDHNNNISLHLSDWEQFIDIPPSPPPSPLIRFLHLRYYSRFHQAVRPWV
jgi:hypothetical protein